MSNIYYIELPRQRMKDIKNGTEVSLVLNGHRKRTATKYWAVIPWTKELKIPKSGIVISVEDSYVDYNGTKIYMKSIRIRVEVPDCV